MNELKRVVSALAVMVLLATPLVAALPAAADDGGGPRGLFASLELWLEHLLADFAAEFLPSQGDPPAAAGSGTADGSTSASAGDGNEFMGLIIPGG